MRMILFAGPSLAGAEMAIPSGIECRPPARQGDIYLATLENPKAIGIIDGLFEGAPSVWHKEILWALSEEIPVLGAASMGALRAAELHRFGMIGIGTIYEAYRDDTLEDDDEVALQHAPEEMGYAALGIAMVNIRATCDAGLRDKAITPDQYDRVIQSIKSIYYKDRTWDRISAVLDGSGDSEHLKSWLKNNYVDQKQRDAIALIECMRSGNFSAPDSLDVQDFRFENTDLWQKHVAEWRRRLKPAARGNRSSFRLIDDDRLHRRGYD